MPGSLCKFPSFDFAFEIPLPSIDIPLPDLDFLIDIDLECPLD